MRSKEANRMFLMIVLLDLSTQIMVSFYYMFTDASYDLVKMDVLTEAILLVPTFFFLFIGKKNSGMSIAEQVGLKRVKPVPLLLSVVYLVLLAPLTTLANLISLLFTENTVENMEEEILALPIWATILMIGIIGPVVEEFVFRGAALHAYRRDRPAGYAPIILSSLLFALVHMNLNQAVYAMVIGIGLGLLCEAAGSLVYPMVCHMLFNSFETVMLYVMKDVDKTRQTGTAYYDELKEAIAVMLIVALICTCLAVCVLHCIRKVCSSSEAEVRAPGGVPYPGYQYTTLATPSLITGIGLCIALIIFMEII